MPASVAATVGRKMAALEKSMTGKGPIIGLAKKSKALIETEVRRDAGGDLAMSNWRRSKPIQIKARDTILDGPGLLIEPQARARGPMRVLNDGRIAGVSERRRSLGRRYPASRGKGTWTRGRKKVEDNATKTLRREYRASTFRAFRS